MLNRIFYQPLFNTTLWCLVLTLLLSTNAFAVTVNVSVDRNPVSINDSFKLIFSSSESPDDDPDFSPLEKDFQILNQQKSSQSSWVNGQSTKSISWTLDVMAKQVGELQIPVISFGDDVTAPLTIKVLAAALQSDINPNDELYLEVSATPEKAYIQAQILYTVRLFQRVNITQAALSEPKAGNAIVEKLGDDTQYNKLVNGVQYRVTERKYAIFPQQSGPLDISALELTAQVVTSSPRSRFGSIFDSQRTQTKRVFSKVLTLDVLAAPSNFKAAHWLAAEQLHLQQTWSNDDMSVTVGEPLTRTLTLLGKGITSSQLPELSLDGTHAALKMYPDQAVVKDKMNPDGVIAFKEQKIALIPSQAGQYRLPAIEIPWFNTQTEKLETASIPAVTITAVAKNIAINPTPTSSQVEVPMFQSPQLDAPITAADNDYWQWVALLFGLGWLLTVLWIGWSRFKGGKAKSNAVDQQLPVKQAIKELQKACAANEPKKAKLALLDWGRAQYNDSKLESIALKCSADCQAEIKQLNQSLYAKNGTNWDGSKLAQLVIEHSSKLQKKGEQDDMLEPLHRL